MTNDTQTSPTPDATAELRATAPLGMVLHVADIAESSRFYATLGFVQTGAFPRADGRLTVAFLAYGTSMMLLGRRDELHYENGHRAQLIRRGPLGLGAVLTLRVPDIDPIYRAVRAAGLEVVLEPVDEFYGDRVFMFLDPDGYEWKISQTLAAVDRSDVAAIIAAS